MYPSHAQTSGGLDATKIAVISHGVQRSGTTWIYQILCDLFPAGSVVKTHNYLDLPGDIPVICAYRDFRDCVVSHWRQRNPDRPKMRREEMFLYAGMYQHVIWILDQYVERRGAATVRYERAIARPELIFETISRHLGIQVAPDRQDEILAAHSLEVNQKAIREGRGPDLGLLPHHIHGGLSGTWRQFVDDPDLLTSLLRPQLEKWWYV